MHRFKVENGKVTYQSKYLQSGMWMWFLTLRPSPNLKWLQKNLQVTSDRKLPKWQKCHVSTQSQGGAQTLLNEKLDLNTKKFTYLNAVNNEGKIIKSIWMSSDHNLWTITLFNHPGLVWPSEEQYRLMIEVEAHQQFQVVRVEVCI